MAQARRSLLATLFATFVTGSSWEGTITPKPSDIASCTGISRSQFRQFFLSLPGCIVVLGGPAAVAFILVFLQQAYAQGWLSWESALRIIVTSILGGVGSGACVWYFIIRPQLPAQKNGRAGRQK